MKTMITLSLLLNVVVLVPVCWGIMSGAQWADGAYGGTSAARGILLAIYLAILIASAGLLVRPVPAAVAALLAVQVVYKVVTPFTVGTIDNPVVLSNLGIAAVHLATLGLIVTRVSG